MSVEDLARSIENYVSDNCELEIVDFRMLNTDHNHLDNGELFKFRVKVVNLGSLDMKDVQVGVDGHLKTGLSLRPLEPFFTRSTSIPFDVNAHTSHTTRCFYGKAGNQTNEEERVIVTAHIMSWKASLDHILNERTTTGNVEAKLIKNISL